MDSRNRHGLRAAALAPPCVTFEDISSEGGEEARLIGCLRRGRAAYVCFQCGEDEARAHSCLLIQYAAAVTGGGREDLHSASGPAAWPIVEVPNGDEPILSPSEWAGALSSAVPESFLFPCCGGRAGRASVCQTHTTENVNLRLYDPTPPHIPTSFCYGTSLLAQSPSRREGPFHGLPKRCEWFCCFTSRVPSACLASMFL
ncbi:hypothetical protein SKAU_G00144800 [Synaphobranchus kaupii]|uniref:Uncharacterized protein n=1 Tax=Synaphobranchus kaupii TaxID=118154 RepID=A0A9Q1FTE5_SYNKA|nr:hypothetical protein SKAU_G00144800 [Synaphobranchus kaupii]